MESKLNRRKTATRRASGSVTICNMASLNVVAGEAPLHSEANKNPLRPK